MNINKMPPPERSAAMRGGMDGWGQVGSAADACAGGKEEGK